MIEYLNNPALLILACEVIAFLLISNIVLVILLARKNNKATRALNSLVTDIKNKSEENKKQITELLLQPDMIDPEAIKQGMQNLINGQTQLYKDMIKAIRTQKIDDVSKLGQSVSSLLSSAIKIGRATGEQVATKEAEEAQQILESEKQILSDANQELKSDLKESKEEVEAVTEEYQRMMNNSPADSADKSKQETTTEEENVDASEEDVIDITASETEEAAEEVIDITADAEEEVASEADAEPEAEQQAEASTEQQETTDESDQTEPESSGESAKEVIEDILGIDKKNSDEDSDKAA